MNINFNYFKFWLKKYFFYYRIEVIAIYILQNRWKVSTCCLDSLTNSYIDLIGKMHYYFLYLPFMIFCVHKRRKRINADKLIASSCWNTFTWFVKVIWHSATHSSPLHDMPPQAWDLYICNIISPVNASHVKSKFPLLIFWRSVKKEGWYF